MKNKKGGELCWDNAQTYLAECNNTANMQECNAHREALGMWNFHLHITEATAEVHSATMHKHRSPKKREAKLRRWLNARLGGRLFRRNATYILWSSWPAAGIQVQLYTYLGHHSQPLFTTSSLIRENYNSRRRRRKTQLPSYTFPCCPQLKSKILHSQSDSLVARNAAMEGSSNHVGGILEHTVLMFKYPTLRRRSRLFSFGCSLSSKPLLKSPF